MVVKCCRNWARLPVSRPIAYRGVALGGRGHAGEGGARSGSVSRLISRCHSATVGSSREGAAKKLTGIGWLCREEILRENILKPNEQ